MLLELFRAEYVTTNGRLACDTQAAYIVALKFGILSTQQEFGDGTGETRLARSMGSLQNHDRLRRYTNGPRRVGRQWHAPERLPECSRRGMILSWLYPGNNGCYNHCGSFSNYFLTLAHHEIIAN